MTCACVVHGLYVEKIAVNLWPGLSLKLHGPARFRGLHPAPKSPTIAQEATWSDRRPARNARPPGANRHLREKPMTRTALFATAAAFALAAALPADAKTQVSWWHAMTGANAEVVKKIVDRLQRQPVGLRGDAGLQGHLPGDAERRHRRLPRRPGPRHPAGLRRRHRRDDGGARRDQAGRRGVVEGGFDKSHYLPGIVAYYSTPDGTMLCFPFNSSSPILYFNKDIFEKAGLDVERPAEDLERRLGGREEDQGIRRRVLRLHLGLAHLDPPRELRRLEQRPLRHQRERPRRLRGRAADQRADLRQPLPGRSPTSPRTAPSSTAAAPPRRSRSSSPANAASSTTRPAASATS